MKKYLKIIWDGISPANPVLIIAIGLCSVIAVSNSVKSALLMTFSFGLVLIPSEIIISTIRKLIPDEIRVPMFVVVIAAFTTMSVLLSRAYFTAIYDVIKLYILLIVVNCIIIGRAEAFAYVHPVVESLFDGIGMTIGYGWVLTAIAVVRELLGKGTLAGIQVLPQSFQPALIMILPPAGFLMIGILVGALETYLRKKGDKK
ncbi:MAG: electron transport complex subunit RsxE [Caldiserica bacterium CG23_combo_of_CG06-09_8_20_14_all_35_60]|nr:electron transport complex subunit RsxE [Caldisericota bacterium]PIP49929.1 MAG: electron transport complex subunit RsxE [Caldiserica bacterium CG23_combo_of_CG06-09_8_20_14_all_35_60]PIX29214.1 MAG: electron transport complex subunit RsxE [Caldiserica bacterium CG_4_8_14_3_um_filter_35_18]